MFHKHRPRRKIHISVPVPVIHLGLLRIYGMVWRSYQAATESVCTLFTIEQVHVLSFAPTKDVAYCQPCTRGI